MSNGQFVDGEDDIFDNDEELERILEADNEAPEEIQVWKDVLFYCILTVFICCLSMPHELQIKTKIICHSLNKRVRYNYCPISTSLVMSGAQFISVD